MDELELGNLDLDLSLDNLELDLGSNKSALEAGVDSAYAGLSESARLFYEYSPLAHMMEGVGLLDRAKADEVLAQEARSAREEYAKFKPTVASVKDIETGGDFLNWAGENLALGAPQIAALFMGGTGLALIGAEATGTTLLEQEEGGFERDVGRAALTGSIEAVMNMPLGKAAKGIFAGIEKSNLDEVAKKNLTAELLQGMATDVGLNGLQQIVRNYGVEGEISTKNLDEALLGGLLMSAPIRGANALTNGAVKDKIVDAASEHMVKTGDVQKPDSFLQNIANYTYGKALRPIRRIANIPAGKQILEAFENMRDARQIMTSEYTTRIDDLFGGVKDHESFIRDYTKGKRDTPQLQELQNIMDSIHARAVDKLGANLGTKYINNYLPTIIDSKLFDAEARANLKADYEIWYNENAARIMKMYEGANVKKVKLVSPETAARIIDDFDAIMNTDRKNDAFKLSRLERDEEGNFKPKARVEATQARKEGSLEMSRMLGFIPQELLSKYAVKEAIPEQLKQYAFSAAQRITYAEQLGKDNERLNAAIQMVGKELKSKGREFELKDSEVGHIYDTLDAYQGMYRQFEDEGMKKVATVARTATNIVALPLTLLSSLTEVFNLAIKVGNKQAMDAFIKSMSSMSQDLISTITRGSVPRSEVGKQLLLAGRGLREATTALNNRVNGEYGSKMNKTGWRKIKSLTAWNNLFFHVTGQTTMNYLVNSMAAHAAAGQVKNDIMIVNGYKNSRLAAQAGARLNAVGIPATQFKTLHDNPKLLDQFMPSIVAKFNKDVALNPEALDKPLWMSTGWGAMFGQLKGYPTMFANTVLPPFLSLIDPRGKTKKETAENVAQFATTFGSILFVGFLQEALKNEVRGGTDTDEELFVKAIKNTVAPIQAGMLYDVLVDGKLSRNFTPAAVSITESILAKATKEEVKLEDLPIFSSFKGLF